MDDKVGVEIPALPRLKDKLRAMSQTAREGNVGVMKAAAGDVVDIIRERTQGGVDVDGAAFEPWTDAYRQREGKSGQDYLDLSGRMLGAIRGQALDGRTARVFVQGTAHGGINSHSLAVVHNQGLGHQPKRRFFGISRAEAAKVISSAASKLRALILRDVSGK